MEDSPRASRLNFCTQNTNKPEKERDQKIFGRPKIWEKNIAEARKREKGGDAATTDPFSRFVCQEKTGTAFSSRC